MATAEEVLDALFDRIAHHAVDASVDDVLKLAKAYDLLIEGGDDDDD
jgi:hypothetical protein